MTAHPASQVWDIFCKVVDNYGDAGVCWRLAHLLSGEHGVKVRLWIDRPATLQALQPALEPKTSVQTIGGIEVCDWSRGAPVCSDATVVIEAFGCSLPESYVMSMAARRQPPLWIILDYLSAESWVDSHHGLASPHPRLALQRWYFYPGFSASTGGLLRERDLLARRDAWDAAARQRFWRDFGFPLPADDTLVLSLFAYAEAPAEELFEVLATDADLTVVAVPGGEAMPAIRRFFGGSLPHCRAWDRGALQVRLLPFLPQLRYDELLWSCDFNFVRGEDSFVRAQWAARPLVWQPYRQEGEAHQHKLEAFLGRYLQGLPCPTADALRAFTRLWSAGAPADLAIAWGAVRGCREALGEHARRWSEHLAGLGEMSAKLVEFARNRVK